MVEPGLRGATQVQYNGEAAGEEVGTQVQALHVRVFRGRNWQGTWHWG